MCGDGGGDVRQYRDLLLPRTLEGGPDGARLLRFDPEGAVVGAR